MIPKTTPAALALSLLSILTSAAHAQIPAWLHWFDWPTDGTLGGTADFGRSISGRFVGNARPCAATLRGMIPVLAVEPHLRQSLSHLRTLAYDLDTLTNGGPLPAQDAIVTVGPLGLQLWVSLPAVPTMVGTLLDNGAWANARLVRCADLDADGDDDVVGIGADGRTLLAIYQQPDGSWVNNLPVSIPDDVLRMELAQWTPGSSMPRFVLAHAGKLDVRTITGTLLTSFPSPSSSTAQVIAVLDRDVSLGDQVAWAQPTASGSTQQLIIVDAAGTEPAVSLGSNWVVEMSACDLDGDDDGDLCVCRTSIVRAEFWIHQDPVGGLPPQLVFDPQEVVTHDLGLPPTSHPNRALPLLHDFDSDGSTDLYLPIDDYSGVSFLSGVHRLLGIWPATWDDMTFELAEGCFTEDSVELTVSATFPDVQSQIPSLNGYEIVLWWAEHYDDEVTATALSRCLREFGELGLPAQGGGGGTFSWTFTFAGTPEDLDAWGALFFMELRPVEFSEGTVHKAGPQLIGAFSMDQDNGFEFVDLYPPGSIDLVYLSYCPPGSPVGALVGGFVRGKRIPPSSINNKPESDVECQNDN